MKLISKQRFFIDLIENFLGVSMALVLRVLLVLAVLLLTVSGQITF